MTKLIDATKEHEEIFSLALKILKPKRVDYGGQDPFGNFRRSTIFDVPPSRGALIRMMDKISRFHQLAQKGGKGAVSDEKLRDTVIDAVNYMVIAYQLLQEELGLVQYQGSAMSRSRTKVPVFRTGKSAKSFKQKANRALRHSIKQGKDKKIREVSDIYDSPKDGAGLWNQYNGKKPPAKAWRK